MPIFIIFNHSFWEICSSLCLTFTILAHSITFLHYHYHVTISNVTVNCINNAETFRLVCLDLLYFRPFHRHKWYRLLVYVILDQRNLNGQASSSQLNHDKKIKAATSHRNQTRVSFVTSRRCAATMNQNNRLIPLTSLLLFLTSINIL